MREVLRIDKVPIDSLQPNDFNPNVVSPANEEKLKESLKRFGQFKPIICRTNNGKLEIIGGEHRWRAAKELGYAEVSVVNLGEISEEDAKKIALIDNGRYGEDDIYKLMEVLNDLGDIGDLTSYMPYETDSLENLFSNAEMDLNELEEDDSEEEEEAESILSLGSAPKTHVVMRFKIPVENQEVVQKAITALIKNQGYDDEDELINAGDALVYLVTNARKEE